MVGPLVDGALLGRGHLFHGREDLFIHFEAAAAPWSMPELRWRWGYPVSLAMMFASAAGMYWFFRRRGLLRPELTMVDAARPPS